MNEDQFVARASRTRVRIRRDISDSCWDSIGLNPDRVEGKIGVARFAHRGWELLFPDGGIKKTYSIHVAGLNNEHLGYFPPYALIPACMFEETMDDE